MLSLAQGKTLVKAAREIVTSKIQGKSFKLEGFEEKSGVFVTIHNHPENELRGCIGFPEPVFILNEAIMQAAKAAAFSDPRFNPLQEEELDKIIFEISVLTKPEIIKVKNPKDYKEKIKIGVDGLVAESQGLRGLLLPQVAPECNMDYEEFLCSTCEKAGLPREAWKNIEHVKIYKFQAQIFKETRPKGDIIESKDF